MNRLGGRSEHRRGRRGPGARDAACQRRQQVQRHQAGGVGPLRRDQPLPVERRSRFRSRWPRAQSPAKAATCPGEKVYPWIARGSPLHAGRGPDLPAAAPRHLLHRGPGGAHLRPEERQPRCARVRQAVSRRRAWAPSPPAWRRAAPTRSSDRRSQRRHGRGPARLHLPCGHPVRDRPGGDPADAFAQRLAQPRGRGDRRQAHVRPRRGHGGPARRRGVRLRHYAAGGHGLHDAARLPAGYLPGGHRHAELQAARLLRR